MASPRLPATPVTPAGQKQQQPTPTGAWKHPKFNEITRRQYAANFDESNVRAILVNGLVLALSFAAFNVTPHIALVRALQYVSPSSTQSLGKWAYSHGFRKTMVNFKDSIPYSSVMLWIIRLLFIVNIVQAVWPLLLRYYPDDIADIPLTPSQRQAMGLDPSVSTPQTPGSNYASPNYITPPRYQKATPRSSFGTPGERHTPVSGSPRASMAKSTSNSPFSPSTGSPLFQKAVGAGSATKRLSYDSRGSPLGNSSLFMESSSSNIPSTPTPGAGKASVGLNNKWLYEKRRDSRGSSLFT